MGPIIKIVIGIVLMIVSIWWIVSDKFGALLDLKTVLNGVIPIAIFLLGIFILWLELDEIKIEKEIKRETRKRTRRK